MSIRPRKWKNAKGEENTAWIVDYKDQVGKRRHKQFERKKDADAFRRKVENEIDRGIHVPDREALTFADITKLFLAECERKRRIGEIGGGGRLYNIQRNVKNHLLPAFAGLKINRFDDARMAQTWAEQKLDEFVPPPRGKGQRYNVRTVQQMLVVLNMILDFTVRERLGLKRNPLQDAWPRLPERDFKEAAFLEAEDVQKLILWTMRPRLAGAQPVHSWLTKKMLVQLALYAGLRAGECCGLNWEDVRLDDWEIDVRHSYSKHDGLKSPKTKRGRRTVPISGLLYPALSEYHERRGRPKSGPVLVMRERKRMPTSLVSSWHWPEIAKQAGLADEDGNPRFTFHSLRHTAGSLWLADDMRPEDVSRFLGHANIDTTWNIYIHKMEHDRRALQALANVSKRFVNQLATSGVQLAMSSRPLQLEPPPPMIDVTPGAVTISPLPAASNALVEHSPTLLEWQRQTIELFKQGHTIIDIGKEVGIWSRRVARFLEDIGLYQPPAKGGYGRSSDGARVREQVLEMASLLTENGEAKHSLEGIAIKFGLAPNMVWNWVKDARLDRPRFVQGAKPRHFREQAMKMIETGMPMAQVAQELGLGVTTVRRWIEQEQVQRPLREQALAMWRAGEPAEKIAAELNTTGVQVGRWADLAGLGKRGRGWKSRPLSDDPVKVRQRERKRAARVASEPDATPEQHDPL